MPQTSSSTSHNHQNGIPSTETSPLIYSSPLSPPFTHSQTHTHVDEHAHHGMIGSKTCSYVGSGPPAIGHPKTQCHDCKCDKNTNGTNVEENVTVKGQTTPSSVRKLCIGVMHYNDTFFSP